MNKLIGYIILLLVYLGLSKSLSPSEFGISYVFNETSLTQIIKGSPVSVVLIDEHSTGFIIKTFYHKYKVIYGFQTYEELIVRVSPNFRQKHVDNIGMSIFRRDSENKISSNALPPGSVFIGNKNFGRWRKNKNGTQYWVFYRVYRYIPQYIGYNFFKADLEFYKEVQKSIRGNVPFYGFDNEFGTKGEVTKKTYPKFYKDKKQSSLDLKQFFLNYFRRNFTRSY